jgi:hypothetical protein
MIDNASKRISWEDRFKERLDRSPHYRLLDSAGRNVWEKPLWIQDDERAKLEADAAYATGLFDGESLALEKLPDKDADTGETIWQRSGDRPMRRSVLDVATTFAVDELRIHLTKFEYIGRAAALDRLRKMYLSDAGYRTNWRTIWVESIGSIPIRISIPLADIADFVWADVDGVEIEGQLSLV